MHLTNSKRILSTHEKTLKRCVQRPVSRGCGVHMTQVANLRQLERTKAFKKKKILP